jgi:integrase
VFLFLTPKPQLFVPRNPPVFADGAHLSDEITERDYFVLRHSSFAFGQVLNRVLSVHYQPYRFFERVGNVCPPNLRKLLEADRTNAGLKKWASNGLRHSFASYHLAGFEDAAKLALEMGHTNQELIFRHYRELVTPHQAEKWWEIRPAEQSNLVALSA